MKTSGPGPTPEALEALLATGRDSALLRMGLALAHHRCGNPDAAVRHTTQALVHDPDFAAAGRLQRLLALECGNAAEAAAAFGRALAAAQRRGDYQLVKELAVRLRRLEPGQSPGGV